MTLHERNPRSAFRSPDRSGGPTHSKVRGDLTRNKMVRPSGDQCGLSSYALPFAPAVVQSSFKDGLSFGFNDTISLADHQSTAARLQHNADGTYDIRSDQAQADELRGTFVANRHNFKGNFVWDLPDLQASGSATRAIGLVLNDWQLSGVWTAATGTAYSVGFSYQNGGSSVNLTGSPATPRAFESSAIREAAAPAIRCSSSTPQRSRDHSLEVSVSSPAPIISAAASRACWIWRLRVISGSAVRGMFSSAPTFSTRRTRLSSRVGTRR